MYYACVCVVYLYTHFTVKINSSVQFCCPALLSCRQAFQIPLLLTGTQGKSYQVQGLEHKENQILTCQQCLTSDDPVYWL